MPAKLAVLLSEVLRVKEIIAALEAGGQKIPFEVDERLHTIEDLIRELFDEDEQPTIQ